VSSPLLGALLCSAWVSPTQPTTRPGCRPAAGCTTPPPRRSAARRTRLSGSLRRPHARPLRAEPAAVAAAPREAWRRQAGGLAALDAGDGGPHTRKDTHSLRSYPFKVPLSSRDAPPPLPRFDTPTGSLLASLRHFDELQEPVSEAEALEMRRRAVWWRRCFTARQPRTFLEPSHRHVLSVVRSHHSARAGERRDCPPPPAGGRPCHCCWHADRTGDFERDDPRCPAMPRD